MYPLCHHPLTQGQNAFSRVCCARDEKSDVIAASRAQTARNQAYNACKLLSRHASDGESLQKETCCNSYSDTKPFKRE
jgi:hypothetical protein